MCVCVCVCVCALVSVHDVVGCNRIKNIRVFFVIMFICLTVSAYLRYINDCCIHLNILLCLQCCSIVVYDLVLCVKSGRNKTAASDTADDESARQ